MRKHMSGHANLYYADHQIFEKKIFYAPKTLCLQMYDGLRTMKKITTPELGRLSIF